MESDTIVLYHKYDVDDDEDHKPFTNWYMIFIRYQNVAFFLWYLLINVGNISSEIW